LGNEVNDEVLTKAFIRFNSFNMARVSISHATSFEAKFYHYLCLSTSKIVIFGDHTVLHRDSL
jgi:hypothetical protein